MLIESAAHDVTTEIIAAAIEVHRRVGPGLLEASYSLCLRHELEARGLRVASQVPVSLRYKALHVPEVYRLDLLGLFFNFH